jgi:hypothetical protein
MMTCFLCSNAHASERSVRTLNCEVLTVYNFIYNAVDENTEGSDLTD